MIAEDHPAFNYISDALAMFYGADEVGQWDGGAGAVLKFLDECGFELKQVREPFPDDR